MICVDVTVLKDFVRCLMIIEMSVVVLLLAASGIENYYHR